MSTLPAGHLEKSVKDFNCATQSLDAHLSSGASPHTEQLALILRDVESATESEDSRIRKTKKFIHHLSIPEDELIDRSIEMLEQTCSKEDIARKRQKTAVVIKNAACNADIVMLPLCDPRWLVAPESVVRCSLFGLGTHRTVTITVAGKQVRERERISFTKKEKPCGFAGGSALYYRGPALDQGDFDVWLQLLERAKDDLNQPVYFSLNSLLCSLGRDSGGKNYKLIVESLERLAEGSFSVSKNTVRGVIDMALIRDVFIDTENGATRVRLDSKAAALFGTEKGLSWTRVEREQRKMLVGKETALWLQAFYSSHAKPIPLKITDLRDACGSNAPKAEFKRLLEGPPENRGTQYGKGALDQLVKVGFISEWSICNGVLKVKRDPRSLPGAQQRFNDKVTKSLFQNN